MYCFHAHVLQELISLRGHLCSAPVFLWVVLISLLVFCFAFLLCLSSFCIVCSMMPLSLDCPFWLPLRFSLTFIYITLTCNKGYHTYTDRSASYLDIHLEIDSEGWLRTKHYDKRDDFNFPIVNFPFICSNIPAAPAYGVYIFQLVRYSRACGSYQDFLDRGLLLTRKLLKQGFLLVMLKSSLGKFYGRHHDLVDRYEISVSQMTTDMFHLS
jgi:hypothetical protein